jgi:hypothetical protein
MSNFPSTRNTPMATAPNGQLIASGLPPLHKGFTQNIQGGPLEHGAAKTLADIKTQAQHALRAGVGMRGGGQMEYHPISGADGGTIPGVSSSANYGKLLGHVNNLRAASAYDHLGTAAPYKVGGKRRRKTKKNGRNRRNNHRTKRKLSRRVRRSNRNAK